MDRSYYMEELYIRLQYFSRLKMDDMVVSAQLIGWSWGLAAEGEVAA